MRTVLSKPILQIVLMGILATSLACVRVSDSDRASSTPSPQQLSSPSAAPEISTRSFDPKLDIGVVIAGLGCSKLLIGNNDLKPDDEVQVVVVDDDQQRKLLAKVVGQNGCPKSSRSAIEDIVVADDGTPTVYEIRFATEDADSGFGVVSSKAGVEIKDGIADLTANNISKPLLFRVCDGNESHHMTVWEGKPLVGKRVWHSYIHLAYDTVPSCKPADYK